MPRNIRNFSPISTYPNIVKSLDLIMLTTERYTFLRNNNINIGIIANAQFTHDNMNKQNSLIIENFSNYF